MNVKAYAQALAFKAFRMVFPRRNAPDNHWWGWWGSGSWGDRLPGTHEDWLGRAGDLWLNSTAAIALGWIERNFSEPELQIVRKQSVGQDEVLDDHPMLALLRAPNPQYAFDDLAAACALSWFCDGNAYVVMARTGSGSGPPGALYWLPHWQVEPVGSTSELITHYLYRVDEKEIRIEPSEMLHFRNGVDPRDPKRGLAELKSCARELVADSEWANWTASLAVNLGVPPVVVAPKSPEVDWDPDTATRIKQQYIQETTRDNRGKPIVIGSSIDLQKPGLTPEEMAVDSLRQWPQDTVIAAFGLNAMVLSLTSGAAHKTHANYKEAREAAYEDCLIPFQRKFAMCLERFLLPNFGGPPATAGLSVRFDYSKVRALQEDRNALYTRTLSAWKDRAIDRAETRAALGFEVREEDEGLYHGDDKAPLGAPVWVSGPEGLPDNGSEPEPAALPNLPPAARASSPVRPPALAAANAKGLFIGAVPWWQEETATNGHGD